MNPEALVAFNVTPDTPPIRFLISLSDGTTVIQDDRPPKEDHAWFRLEKYLKATPGLTITGMRLQAVRPDAPALLPFEVVAPSNQRGYIYGRRIAMNDSGAHAHQVGFGYFDGTTAHIRWYFVPSMIGPYEEQQDKKTAGFKLIENPG